MSTLREQMAADLQLRGITPRTQKKYLREVSNLAKYYHKSPQDLGEQEVKDYLVHLLKDRGISVGTYRTYAAGIKFLYDDPEPARGCGEDQVSQEHTQAARSI
ncbi:MAG: site-specific integrase [Deltaproteobacteria bacterium]